jgi:16S rRNA (guanine(1405)-N(7))-methyltransferase
MTEDAVIAGLRESSKYRNLSASVLARTAQWALARHAGRDALKAAKRKLHQVYAAFCPPGAIARLARLIAELPAPDASAFRAACGEILAGHASTAERLPHLDSLYPRLWELTGPPRSVLDLACGFHPFAMPWMQLPSDAVYLPCDLDERLIEQVNRFLMHVGSPPIARCRDVLGEEFERFDVVLLLKTFPCLEQQEPDAGLRLLQTLPARVAVVSFPTVSLSGRRKGMRGHYCKVVDSLAASCGLQPRLWELPDELFAVFERPAHLSVH